MIQLWENLVTDGRRWDLQMDKSKHRASNTVNTNYRMKYFFSYCRNTTVRKFNNSNINAVNAIQERFVYLQEIDEQTKSSLLLKTLL